MVAGAGGIVSVGVGGPGCGRAAESPAAVLGFSGSMAGMKVMDFCSPVVGVVVVVFGHGAVVGGTPLVLKVGVCCHEVWMELLFLVKSPV